MLFSLPFANSKIERALSTLNLIHVERHCVLDNAVLDDLMEINVEGPPTNCFIADHAVQLWWTNCAQRSSEESDDNSNLESVGAITKVDTGFSLSDWGD